MGGDVEARGIGVVWIVESSFDVEGGLSGLCEVPLEREDVAVEFRKDAHGAEILVNARVCDEGMGRSESVFESFDVGGEFIEGMDEGIEFADPGGEVIDERLWCMGEVVPARALAEACLPMGKGGVSLQEDGGSVGSACDARVEFARGPMPPRGGMIGA